MDFFIKNARVFKWLSLIIGLLAFAIRIIQGELEEEHISRGLTGETRMDGSTLGYLMVGIIIVSLVSFVIFNELSKKKN